MEFIFNRNEVKFVNLAKNDISDKSRSFKHSEVTFSAFVVVMISVAENPAASRTAASVFAFAASSDVTVGVAVGVEGRVCVGVFLRVYLSP